METIEKNSDQLLARVHRTIELIRLYDNGIKQAVELDAPTYLIESKKRMKTQLVREFMTLMTDMNVKFELNEAA